MAVSGRKLSDIQGSISLGSAEDFDHTCEPCLTIGKHIEGHGFCVDCQEYLCNNCLDCHKRTKASRNHKILGKDKFGKQSITSKDHVEPTEKCSVHKNEIIKYFCPTHEELGCNDCIILNHRTCEIDYIPDKCAGIGESEEYRDVVKKLDQTKKEAEDVMAKAEVKDKEIDKCQANIIKEILRFRKEINDRLDQMQEEIQNEAKKRKSNDKKIIQMVLEECDKISSDVTKLQSSLQTNKTSGQNGQLYIKIKRAACKLKLDEVMKAEENLERTDMQYSFERNTEFEKLLSTQNIFGNLNLSALPLTPKKKKTVDILTYKEDIKVSTTSDKYGCRITGCTLLASNKLVLADNNNSKLKIVDIQSKAVIDEHTLDSEPWDIAVLPKDQVAVTLQLQRKIVIMTTAGNIKPVRTIPVQGDCRGITYHQDYLYVACDNPEIVLVLDIQGTIRNTISLNNDIFKSPMYIAVGEGSKHIYISDDDSNSVVRITLQGGASAVYKHKDLSSPRGMLMLSDGSLLVCSYWNNTIHHISGDLKQGQILTNLQDPYSICYSYHDEEVYIGCLGNHLKVYSIKYSNKKN